MKNNRGTEKPQNFVSPVPHLARYCVPTEVKCHVFTSLKKLIRKIFLFFDFHTRTIQGFYQANNKKISCHLNFKLFPLLLKFEQHPGIWGIFWYRVRCRARVAKERATRPRLYVRGLLCNRNVIHDHMLWWWWFHKKSNRLKTTERQPCLLCF